MNLLRAVNASLLKLAGWGTIFFMGIIAVVIPYEVPLPATQNHRLRQAVL